MKLRTHAGKFALIAFLGLSGALTFAGPEDQATKYPVGIGIGDQMVEGGIVDSGGTTTISFSHAWALGLIDDDGNPVNPPDGTVTLGGTGGGSVKCHKFNNVKIKVQPKNADGTNNGPAKEVTVTVYVPMKPEDQDGANDAEKSKKTNSVVTKIGANVVGAKFGDSKLDLTDKATDDPKKNKRSTGWAKLAAQGEKKAPVVEDDNFEDEVFQQSVLPGGARFNGLQTPAFVTSVPVTGVAMPLAQAMNIVPVGQEPLDFESHSVLFLSGWTSVIPDAQNPVMLPWGYAMVQIPTDNGGTIDVQPVRTFILPMGFVENPVLAIVGTNGLIPADHHGWFENDTNLLHVSAGPGPCAADFNGDGQINTLDVLAFLNAWVASDPAADFNGDGQINTLDVLAFLNAWNTGCD
jgi:hypothetical protein